MSWTKNILMSWMKNILKIKLAHERWCFLLKNIGAWMIHPNILIFWQDFRRGLNVKWHVYVIALSHILIYIFFPILTFFLQKNSTIYGIFLSKGKNWWFLLLIRIRTKQGRLLKRAKLNLRVHYFSCLWIEELSWLRASAQKETAQPEMRKDIR